MTLQDIKIKLKMSLAAAATFCLHQLQPLVNLVILYFMNAFFNQLITGNNYLINITTK